MMRPCLCLLIACPNDGHHALPHTSRHVPARAGRMGFLHQQVHLVHLNSGIHTPCISSALVRPFELNAPMQGPFSRLISHSSLQALAEFLCMCIGPINL